MCVIITNLNKKDILKTHHEEVLEVVLEGRIRNEHGVGILAYPSSQGVFVRKLFEPNEVWLRKDTENLLSSVREFDLWAIHCRKASRGPKTEENIHPFEIKVGEQRAWVVHNGTLDGFGDNERSDTKEFADFVSNYLRKNNLTINSASLAIFDAVSSWDNRFLVMTDSGEVYLYGGFYKLGNGLIVSNLFSVPEEIMKKYDYTSTKIFYSGKRILSEEKVTEYPRRYYSYHSPTGGYYGEYYQDIYKRQADDSSKDGGSPSLYSAVAWDEKRNHTANNQKTKEKDKKKKKNKLQWFEDLVRWLRKREIVLKNSPHRKDPFVRGYYHESSQRLYLTASDGEVWKFSNVPKEVAETIMQSHDATGMVELYLFPNKPFEVLGKREFVTAEVKRGG